MGTVTSGGIGMKILSFHLRGKMAHFRKFYANSSALTYFIPPRTTLIGILAGLLGYERDSYYEQFSQEKCKIAIASKAPIKKCMQKMNLLKIEGKKDLNGSAEYHSQTATEFIIPHNIRTGFIDYQIWVWHKDEKIMDGLIGKLKLECPGYQSKGISLALGTAFNLGWLENFTIIEGKEKSSGEEELVRSTLPIEKIKEIKTQKIGSDSFRFIKEEVPLEFDAERKITDKGLGNMLINLEGKPILAEVESCVQLEDGSSIMWME